MNTACAGADRWGVAAPHRSATNAGQEVLGAGGNAVDAALAAASALTVSYPHQCSIGGDCIALVGLPDGTVYAVNGIGRYPAAFLAADLQEASSMPIDGPLTVTVPGVVAAWQTMADTWGTKSLSSPLSAAATMAGEGVLVAPGLARALVEQEQRVQADPGLREVFAPGGQLLTAGSLLVQPALHESLTAIGERGSAELYGGPVGRSIVTHLRGLGSRMSIDDFATHQTAVTSPISTAYGDTEYITAPPPSQGAFFLESLAALEHVRLAAGRPLDLDGQDTASIAAILHRTSDDRDRLLGDPDVTRLDLDHLLTVRAPQLAGQRTHPAAGLPNPAPTGDTVAVVTADGSGMWVSLIQSLFHSFGSGILDPATGITLHNRGASFTVSPGHPGAVGARRRPPHTLMPVLARRDGVLVGTHGTMGGRAQAQIHVQLALRIAAGMSPREAIDHPRWILGASEAGGDKHTAAYVEPGVSAVARAALAKGFNIAELVAHDDEVGHAQAIRRESDGKLVGGSDCRSDGAFLSGGS